MQPSGHANYKMNPSRNERNHRLHGGVLEVAGNMSVSVTGMRYAQREPMNLSSRMKGPGLGEVQVQDTVTSVP